LVPRMFRVESLAAARTPGDGPLVVGAGDAVVISGIAFNETRTGPPPAVFLDIDGTRDFPAHPAVYRDILGGGIRHRGARWAGFIGSFAATLLPPGDHTVSLKIVADDERHEYLTEPIARVIRR